MSSLHERILVVEDDTQIRNFICFTLEAEAYVCHTAATAEEAMRLLARIRVALRLDAEKRKVYLGEAEIHVTPMEYSLLLLLFKNQGKVLTTSVILREIWGAGYGQDTQALRTLTAGLRRKIEKNPARPRYILTEIGVGYRLAGERE